MAPTALFRPLSTTECSPIMSSFHPAAIATMPVPAVHFFGRLRASVPAPGPTSVRLPDLLIRTALVTDLLLIIGLVLRG